MVWYNDIVPNPDIPFPKDYGWKEEIDKFVPVITTSSPAPDAILQLVKCGCSEKTRCNSQRCKCKSNQLYCTELCNRGADEDLCKNMDFYKQILIDDDNYEEDV